MKITNNSSTLDIAKYLAYKHRVFLLVLGLTVTWTWILVTNLGRGW